MCFHPILLFSIKFLGCITMEPNEQKWNFKHGLGEVTFFGYTTKLGYIKGNRRIDKIVHEVLFILWKTSDLTIGIVKFGSINIDCS
jgi:hypothetical protein